MADVQWYYARDNQQFGPVSATELKQLADAGSLAPDDLLWREGMEAWATAINLRGLFAEDIAAKGATTDIAQANELAQSIGMTSAVERNPSGSGSLSAILRSTQAMLWGICVLVVLFGLAAFTRAFLIADNPTEEAAAAAVFATFFIAAYVLARSGERLCKLLMARARRRSR